MKARAIAGLLLLLVTTSCSRLPPGWPMDYIPIVTLFDDRSGFYVELAEINSMSAFGYQVNVFTDSSTRGDSSTLMANVIEVTGVDSPFGSFEQSGGCYVLTVNYHLGGLISPTWKNPGGKGSICFGLRKSS